MSVAGDQESNPRALAERVRAACVAAAKDGYEDAAMSGLCDEGALEAAISAIERLELGEIVDPGVDSGTEPGASDIR